VASVSRIGNHYDSAKVESFVNTLKQQEIDGTSYRGLRHAERRIGSFIEQVCNRYRLHLALDCRSSLEFEVVAQRRPSPSLPGWVFKTWQNLPR
jgi:putative transposase